MADQWGPPGPRKARPEYAVIADVLLRGARPISAGCAASMVHQACEALVPLAIGLAVQRAAAGSRLVDILIAVAGVLGLFLVLATSAGVAYWTLNRTSQQEAHELRVRAMGRILADPQVGRERTAGELMSIVTSDITATAQVTRFVASMVSGLVGVVVTVVVLIRIDVLLGLCVVLAVPPLVLGLNAVSPRLETKLRHRQQAGGLTAALAAEIVHALRPLRGFGGVREASRRYRTLSRTSLQTDREAASTTAVMAGTGRVAIALVTAGIAAAAGPMAFSGRIDVGEFVTVVAMAAFVSDPVGRVTAAVQQLAISRASAARVAPLLATAVPAQQGRGALAELIGPLRLRNVTAGPVRGLDLTLKPGEMLGVVTSDSTAADALAAVLAGDSRPETGRVCVGDRALDTVERHGLRQHILVAPHAVRLLGRTIEAAMDTGRGTGSAQTGRALAAVGLSALAGDLTDGATNLSGGQRQRVALARAVAADPPVLVLQDPLTAVDAVTEDTVAGHLATLRRESGRTTVVIATSPQLLSRCDQVVFVGNSGTPAVGTHTGLLDLPDYAWTVLR